MLVATEEQCVLVPRWVDDDLEVHEDILGMDVTAITDA